MYGGGIGFGGSMGIKFACECSPHPSATHPPSPLEKAKGVDFVFCIKKGAKASTFFDNLKHLVCVCRPSVALATKLLAC